LIGALYYKVSMVGIFIHWYFTQMKSYVLFPCLRFPCMQMLLKLASCKTDIEWYDPNIGYAS
jgi:hypothetical protein